MLHKDRLYIKMLRIHLFSIFIIKTPQTLNLEDTDKCTLIITKVNVYQLLISLYFITLNLNYSYN